ncbi:MAG: hypothetical protein CO145_02625 [Candidatus Nealsonbacteria bacterium CG_4_9_14_3_um_filter_37_13]|uniref:Restriction endonuclease n=2 Tax=Candidatus Nealsoniibacteriota TaxID=1817911 RepID=A0A2H0TLP8_9BACT|nr:MAG: hypothetical protein COU43_00945 [Candidatus Nealsonbacteria bacterium CG10_big_fil_rev_8_21_14_0_10_37_25]PJA84041.1 MAG: hypothetical protein CO145_02625 [Candidatus Nealsonbacteria bacterium CG_4_9_14_3_um_filter_37_13]
MNIKNLDKQIKVWIEHLAPEDKKILLARLSSLKSIFPFNEYEYRLMYLLDKEIITFGEYEKLRDNFVSENPYLELYGIAPRIFGEQWAQQHLMDIDSRFKKPSKTIDPKFQGEYDLYIPFKKKIIKVEVKACRAINTKVRGKLESKALPFSSKEPFWMNFQQIKLDIVDAFVFIGVWTNKILYWVLTNKEVKTHPIISHQHRGGIEYQIGITNKNIKQFKKLLVKPKSLVKTIISKCQKL